MNHDNIDIYQEEEDLQENEQSDDALLIAVDQPADLLLIQNEIIGPVSIDRIGDHESVAASKPVPDDTANKKEESSDDDDDDDESSVSDFVFSMDEEEEEGELEDGEEKEIKPQKKIQNNNKKNKKQKDEDDDDDDEFDKEKSNNPLRTKHELEQVCPWKSLDIVIPPTAILTEIGQIFAIVGDTIVIESTVTDITLDADSILCSSALQSILIVCRQISRNLPPKFRKGNLLPLKQQATESNENDDTTTKAAELEVEEPIKVGDKVFFVKEMAKYVFAAQLKLMKGSDASNFYDEEVADAEMEFSDDEKEAEYKRALKLERTLKKRAREGTTGATGVDEDNAESLLNRGKRGDRGGRGGRRNSNDHTGALGMQRTYEKGFDAQRDRYQQQQQQDRPQHRQQYPPTSTATCTPFTSTHPTTSPKTKTTHPYHYQTPQHHASMTSYHPTLSHQYHWIQYELLRHLQSRGGQLPPGFMAGINGGVGGGGLDGAPFNNNGGGPSGGFNPMLMNPPMMMGMGMGMQGYMMGSGTGAGAPGAMGASMGYANSGYPPYQENPESENKE
ncbi:hypothetical protein BDR26DRAFT_936253 [Obelidium mucronatum]|nr:hypothetical protein BDR26DRAFT_936253 [Obelidium mucronatum]